MAKMSIWERIKMMTGMGKAGAFQPGAKMLQDEGRHRPSQESPKERAEERKKKEEEISP